MINNKNLIVTTINDKSGAKIGYDIKVVKEDVILKCRWRNGTMIGSLQPLIDKQSQMYAIDAKSKLSIKSMAKYERSIGKVHKAMRRMGYQSKK